MFAAIAIVLAYFASLMDTYEYDYETVLPETGGDDNDDDDRIGSGRYSGYRGAM